MNGTNTVPLDDGRRITVVDYHLASPDGRVLRIPKELFEAFSFFLGDARPTGSVEVEFKNGGICGVETSTRKRYK